MSKNPKKGIDVSFAQNHINWESVKKSGIDFAIIRSSFGSDLPSQTDNQFYQNAQGCVKNNIPFGTYHFAYFINEQKARDEADFAIRLANEYRGYVKFIVLDIEEDTENYAKRVGASPNWTNCVIAFMERIKENGYTPVLYCNQNWLINKLNYNKVKKYNLWYAAIGTNSPKYNPSIWQYSWTGKVPGINGDVDMDYLYDDSLLNTNTRTSSTSYTVSKSTTTDDKTRFLTQARTYIGQNGDYVCNTKLHLGYIDHWCAFAVSAIVKDCGFIGKYIKKIEGGAGSIPRESDGKYGKWFKKGTMSPQAGDLFFLRYEDYPSQDKYFCDHVGIIESVNGNALTTLEGNVDGSNGNWAKTSTFKRKARYLSDNIVYAFYRPNWQTGTKTTTTSSTAKKSSSVQKQKQDTQIYQLTSSSQVNMTVMVKAANGVNIRQGADTSYNRLGAIPYGATVNVTRQTSGGGYTWGLVKYNGVQGWIALEYTTQIISFKKGDKVKVKNGAVVYGTNTKLNNIVYKNTYQVMEVSGNRIVIGINGQVTTAIDKKYLVKT
jgi:GH25 family lysozyme M1 (1,4-beta-N-acetylmuramidase)